MKRYYPALIVAGVMLSYFFYFSQRYVIGLPGPYSACLQARYFIVDTWDKDIEEGDLVAFYMNSENHFYPQGLSWVKLVAAGPNSSVHVTPSHVHKEGGEPIELDMTYLLNIALMDQPIGTPEDFTKTHHLGDDEYFMIGDTMLSYDSRFWGYMKTADIRGKAYAIF
jgi:type IV secretory pathway protease TraF